MEKEKILYVDDDKENLRTFRRLYRREYQVLLAESGEEGLQVLEEHAPIPVIITDQRMPEMTGIEFLDRSLKISPDSIRIIITGFTDVQALIDAINTGRVYRYITKPWDEQELYVTIKRAIENYELKAYNTRLLRDLQEKHEQLEASYNTLQETQEKLIDAEKLASIGRLASRIAHELRNPIQGIRMGLELVKQDLLQLSDAKEIQTSLLCTLEHVDQEIISVNAIIKDLLEYSRDMTFDYTETEVNSIVEGVLFNMQDQVKAHQITVKTNYGEQGTMIADGIRLRQVLVNLVQNAIESMNSAGTLTLTTAPHDENHVMIQVRDTGAGMTEEQQHRIFEPFFTTKEKGVGLGMAIVHRIIEAHQGTIDVESEPGQGTAFTITLPKNQDTEGSGEVTGQK